MNKILYNVTIIIDERIANEWKEWMLNTHIPDVMSTGFFESYKLSKMLSGESEGGVTYAIQYIANNMDALKNYQAGPALKLQAEHSNRYANKFAAFRSMLEVMSESV